MKKIATLMFLIGLSLVLVTGPHVLAGELINGEEVEGIAPPAENALSCSIRDESGATVTTCRVSDPWSYDVVGYWVYFSGATWTKAKVIIKIKGSDLPEKKIINSYKIPEGYSGSTVTPFAITDWAGISTYGTGSVKVKTDAGTATCTFAIAPYEEPY